VRFRCVCVWVALAFGGVVPAVGQQWLSLEGIADGEFWATDSGSTVAARNNGHPAPAGRVQLLAGVEAQRIELLFMGEVEGGKANEDGETDWEYDQLMLRILAARFAVIDIGKFPSPLGAFANRRLSTINPLIGEPDGYPTVYPWGAMLNGTAWRVDYRAGAMSLPATHEDYSPDPTPVLRPVFGAGITPIPELRLGTSFTWGPYLNDELGPVLPAGADWQAYKQRVLAFDTRFSLGYFEMHAELGLSSYDVPSQTSPVDGIAYYVEGKQTWSARLFNAVRFERNDYPFIRPVSATQWVAQRVDGYNTEVGAGFRIDRSTTLKASYRWQWWSIAPALRSVLLDGYALAFQLSYNFDPREWVERMH